MSGQFFFTMGSELWRAPMDGIGAPSRVLTAAVPFAPFSLGADDLTDSITWCNGVVTSWVWLSNPGYIHQYVVDGARQIFSVEMLRGGPVVLDPTPSSPSPGDLLRLTVRGTRPFSNTFVWLAYFDGVHRWRRLATAPTGALGELVVTLPVPPGLSGHTATYVAASLAPDGLPGWSPFEDFTFQ